MARSMMRRASPSARTLLARAKLGKTDQALSKPRDMALHLRLRLGRPRRFPPHGLSPFPPPPFSAHAGVAARALGGRWGFAGRDGGPGGALRAPGFPRRPRPRGGGGFCPPGGRPFRG